MFKDMGERDRVERIAAILLLVMILIGLSVSKSEEQLEREALQHMEQAVLEDINITK